MKKMMNTATATISLMLGHALVWLDFFLTEEHVIHDPTLWYFGQCCVLFGTVIGVIKYVNNKVNSFQKG